MELILIEDVPNLGSLGDTVQVKPGYGRNFLIPKGMALLAKGKESKELRHRLEYIKKLREGKIELAKEQATKLSALNLEVVRKAGTEGKLFGSVSNRDLKELLKDKNFDFERKSIILNSPIRSVGIHEFKVRIHSEVSQTVKIKVIGDTENIKLVEKSNQEDNNFKNTDDESLLEGNEPKDGQDVKLEKDPKKKQAGKENESLNEMQELNEKKESKEEQKLKGNDKPKKKQGLKENNGSKEKQELKEKKESKEKQEPKVKREIKQKNKKRKNKF